MSVEVPKVVTPDLKELHVGKVRNSYELDANHMAVVASDRLSLFDVVMNERVPNKGRLLTAASNFWFDQLVGVVPTQMPEKPLELPDTLSDPYFEGRTTIVRKATEMVMLECIVRRHITGSVWTEYETEGTAGGLAMPRGLRQADRLPEPIFTPSTKAEQGQHDQNVTFGQAVNIVGKETAERVREMSLRLFGIAYDMALANGVLLADTKLEFGIIDGELALCDEAFTSDSSRYWRESEWKNGSGIVPPSLDKQYARDRAKALGWNQSPPPPTLGDDVIRTTAVRYQEGYESVTGLQLIHWPGQHYEITA